jgi:hypothetical protein
MSSAQVPVVERADLGALEEIGAGGEGRVYEISRSSDVVYKEYFPNSAFKPDAAALNRLIGKTPEIEGALGRPLSDVASWPHTIVRDGNRFVGFLMARIPERFHVTVQLGAHGVARQRPSEWNYLCRPDSMTKANLRVSATRPSVTSLAAICADLARTVAAFHQHDIVVGDISGRNLLWTTQGAHPAAYVLDCDGCRVLYSGGVSIAKETPQWEDPSLAGGSTTQESDRYKLMLAIYRSLLGLDDARPERSTELHLTPETSGLQPLFVNSLRDTGRPRAEEWIDPLERIASGQAPKRARPPLDLKRGPTSATSPSPSPPAPKRVRPELRLDQQ